MKQCLIRKKLSNFFTIIFTTMKKILVFCVICVINFSTMQAKTFTLSSKDLGGQFTLDHVFTGCGGKNISPELHWSNAPAGTKSFAVLMHDESAPTGSGWWHWLVFDLPSNTTNLPSGAGTADGKNLPAKAIQANTDYGTAGYGGPCPPEGHGWHKYTFTVYALNVDKLGIDAKANAATVGFMVNANTIEKASIVAYYKR
jgi:Raf kinase inhibitor-like YbhB/YbcL family protein